MGAMIFYPMFIAIAAVGFLSPLIAAGSVLGAMACAVVLVVPVPRMVRSERNWLRALGAVLLAVSAFAILLFVAVAGVSLVVALWFYGIFFSG